jgi:hypothetical protein
VRYDAPDYVPPTWELWDFETGNLISAGRYGEVARTLEWLAIDHDPPVPLDELRLLREQDGLYATLPLQWHDGNENTGTPGRRLCHMPDPFPCPECGAQMACINSYGSGSNHYWALRCDDHGRFAASTYRYGEFDGSIPLPWVGYLPQPLPDDRHLISSRVRGSRPEETT